MQFQDLAFDEVSYILSHLHVLDVGRLLQTCRLFSSQVLREEYWKEVCSRCNIVGTERKKALHERISASSSASLIMTSTLQDSSYEWFGKAFFSSLLSHVTNIEFGVPL